MGCGSESDPATNSGADGSSDDGSNGDGQADGTGGDGIDADGDSGDGSTSDGASGDGSATDGNGGGDGAGGDGAGGDGSSGVCTENTNYVGQLFEKDDAPNNGGEETTTPYEATYDAGIAAIVAAGPAAGATADVTLNITGATVIATSFGDNAGKRFWIQDGKSAVQVFLAAPITDGTDPIIVKVGSKLSASVTKLGNYNGMVQITEATGWTVTAVTGPVFIDDRTGKSIEVADANKLVRVTGTLTGEGAACGGSAKCWTFEYGGTTPVTFRSGSQFLATGDCVTFVGPVSRFNETVQLDTVNFDWIWNNK